MTLPTRSSKPLGQLDYRCLIHAITHPHFMNTILLFSLHTPEIKVTIEAYFDAKGNLVVEGYDIGKTVEEYWGDSDYEYSSTINPEEVKKLYPLFQLPEGSQGELLVALQVRFHTNNCYSEIQTFLEKNEIKYTGFSWR